MTYLGLMSGSKAIQYFVRSPEAGFPYAPAAWSEIRKVAAEVRVLTPALLGGEPISVKTTSTMCTLHAGGWKDRDGSIVVIVANLDNKDGLPCQFEVEMDGAVAPPGEGTLQVTSIFENRFINSNVSAPSFAFSDALRGQGVGIYRLERATAPVTSLICEWLERNVHNLIATVPPDLLPPLATRQSLFRALLQPWNP